MYYSVLAQKLARLIIYFVAYRSVRQHVINPPCPAENVPLLRNANGILSSSHSTSCSIFSMSLACCQVRLRMVFGVCGVVLSVARAARMLAILVRYRSISLRVGMSVIAQFVFTTTVILCPAALSRATSSCTAPSTRLRSVML